MKIGRRLAIKLLNAARFALSFELPDGVEKVTEPVDLAMLASLKKVIATSTKAFGSYDHTKALETTESFFWTFTDDYLELVKERAYGQGGYSAQQVGSAVLALRESLGVLVRLMAPFLPYATEEVWSWWQEGSVHLAAWPTEGELTGDSDELMKLASEALILVRKSKSDLKLSMKAEIESATLSGPASLSELVADLKAVGRIADLRLVEADVIAVGEIKFAESQ
jgi:valyl-tRNA synthetase